MRFALRFALAGLGLLAAGVNARGQTPETPQATTQNQQQDPNKDEITAVPNRPTLATTAEAVQRGVLEIEYGFEGGQGHQNINGLVKFGIFKSLELRFANNPLERDAGIAGTGDSGAGFKWKIFPQRNARPTVSLLYTATIPTAPNELGAGAVGHSVQALLSKDFGKEHFDVNEGVQFVGRPAPGKSVYDRNYFTSLSWSRTIRGKWGVTAELAGFSRTNADRPATMTILGAPTYNVSSRLVLDAGAYVAAYGRLPRVTFFCGVTYAIADLYRLHPSRRSAKN
jgi:hypothetical protein